MPPLTPQKAFHYLPEKWQERLEAYALETTDGRFKRLGASHFTDHLKLNFPDGSSVFFFFAFHLTDEDAGELAVFTEHCGYHIFPLFGAEIEIIKRT